MKELPIARQPILATTNKAGRISVSKPTPSAMDWRRQQQVNIMMTNQDSTQLLAQLSQREHSAGVRQVGCPCCDPDNPSNYVDSMMML